MAARNDTSPSVVTYADHEVITPAHPLNKAIASASQEDDDPVARAEAALAQLSEQFAEWMQAECERLERARQDVLRQGVTQTTHGELFRAAHDVKGEAATFGYPVVVGAAESLCRLLEHTPDWTRIPLTLGRAARRCGARHRARTLPHRSRVRRRHADAAAARSHRRIPAQRKRRPARLPRRHLRPVAYAVAFVAQPSPAKRSSLHPKESSSGGGNFGLLRRFAPRNDELR
jgi:HPt (histidine-containing phosphotransfer) domain-containing protein